MRLEDLIQRIDQLIRNADAVIQTSKIGSMRSYVNVELFHAFRSASLSFLSMTFGKDHTHYNEFNSQVERPTSSDSEIGRGILSAAREELAGGWLSTTKGLISAEIFSDFLEMAQHLLDEGYKDPAAGCGRQRSGRAFAAALSETRYPDGNNQTGAPTTQESRCT